MNITVSNQEITVRKFAWKPKVINGEKKWLTHYRLKTYQGRCMARWESKFEDG